jgi:hypothetical protein
VLRSEKPIERDGQAANSSAGGVVYRVGDCRAIGLDMQVFTSDLVHHVHLAKVRSDFKSGVLSGVNGTPTFYINGHRHDGSWDFATLSSALLAAV